MNAYVCQAVEQIFLRVCARKGKSAYYIFNNAHYYIAHFPLYIFQVYFLLDIFICSCYNMEKYLRTQKLCERGVLC